MFFLFLSGSQCATKLTNGSMVVWIMVTLHKFMSHLAFLGVLCSGIKKQKLWKSFWNKHKNKQLVADILEYTEMCWFYLIRYPWEVVPFKIFITQTDMSLLINPSDRLCSCFSLKSNWSSGCFMERICENTFLLSTTYYQVDFGLDFDWTVLRHVWCKSHSFRSPVLQLLDVWRLLKTVQPRTVFAN